MTIEFRLPELGENIEAGDVVNVLVSVGDKIKSEQPILELETDKATVEVPSSVDGTIAAVLVKEGDTVRVGQVILKIDETGAEALQTQPLPEEEVQKRVPDSMPTETIEPPPGDEPGAPEEPAAEEEPEATATTIEFRLPELGENVEGGDVINVLVAVGDRVKPDQAVLELETDKATVEVPVTVAGVVREIHVKAGETARVGQVILTLQGAAEKAAQPPQRPQPVETKPQAAARPETRPAPEQREGETRDVTAALPEEARTPPPERAIVQPEPGLSAVGAAPNVRRLAREIGVDITEVKGTGPDGRVSMDDVKRHAREKGTAGTIPAVDGRSANLQLPDFSRWGEVEREAMSNIRRTTAERLSQAWLSVPHVTQFDQADIVELEDLRKRFGPRVEAAGGRLTITAILLKIAAAVLKEFPQFNASVDMARREIIYKKYYHIGVAVDTDRGLLVPVIRDVDRKNIMELAVELGQVAEKARNRKLTLEEMQGGTFTITNLGGIGGTYFTPIVNAPEVAILGVSRGKTEPVFKNGQFEPRLVLPLSLSYDHRLIDGADGIRFLRRVVEYLEQPFLTSLQGW